LGRADFFVTHSHWDKEDLTHWIGKPRASDIWVCPHPRYEHLRDFSLTKKQARASLGIQAERVLLFFGFIREYKGLRYLLESLPEIRSKLDVHLVIAGDVWGDTRAYTGLIENLRLSSSVSFFPGYVRNEEVAQYFAAADLVVAPYVTATQSGIVQLAYGFGKPVIVGNIGGLPEVVQDGRTGYLVPPKDPASIARVVTDFYQNRREHDMVGAILQSSATSSWDQLCQTIDEIAKVAEHI
jgi:glycosyltransferase involved in cell wall biosynthesis